MGYANPGTAINRRVFLKTSAACAAALSDVASASDVAGAAGAPRSNLVDRRPGQSGPAAVGIASRKLHASVVAAAEWLAEIAQVKTQALHLEQNSEGYPYRIWAGAIKNEYSVATATWDFFGPVWHTGQAIKALLRASTALGDPALAQKLIRTAKAGAEFIGNQRISDRSDPNYGLILAFEDRGDEVNTSGILECVDGLILLSDATHEGRYLEWAIAAAHWVANRAYLGDGLFRDTFSVKSWSFVAPPWKNRVPPTPGRPLLDDAVFLKLALRSKNRQFRKIFYSTADRLLQDEDPPGNWVNYAPCNAKMGMLHPRQAYWWGYPMLAAYRDCGSEKYLECARRAGVWYLNAMRLDGGLFRHTRMDFKTTSFNQATSGIGCAAKLWRGLWLQTREEVWRRAIHRALEFQMSVQFMSPRDPNLKGAILEEVLAPKGSDRSPYHIRDLATTFFLQSVSPFL